MAILLNKQTNDNPIDPQQLSIANNASAFESNLITCDHIALADLEIMAIGDKVSLFVDDDQKQEHLGASVWLVCTSLILFEDFNTFSMLLALDSCLQTIPNLQLQNLYLGLSYLHLIVYGTSKNQYGWYCMPIPHLNQSWFSSAQVMSTPPFSI